MKKLPRFTVWVLGILLTLAITRDVLVNGRPFWCVVDGVSYYPAFRAISNGGRIHYNIPAIDHLENDDTWWTLYPDHALFAPIAFSATQRNTARLHPGSVEPNRPTRFRHWMGTDTQGRDVLAGAIQGTRSAVLTGLWTMLVLVLAGGFLGALAGYFGNTGLRVSRGRLWLTILGLLPAFFYGFMARQYALLQEDNGSAWMISTVIFIGIVLIFNLIGLLLSRLRWFEKVVALPADLVIMRVAEVFDAVPKFILLIAIVALLSHRSLYAVMGVVGILYWPEAARYVRAELLRIRALDYIKAARFLQFSEWRILFRHALPNAFQPLWVVFSLGIATAVLLEASLSFLGISTSDWNTVTWGKMLLNAREHLEDWWVFVPPGGLICLLVAALYGASGGEE